MVGGCETSLVLWFAALVNSGSDCLKNSGEGSTVLQILLDTDSDDLAKIDEQINAKP